jgi:predicted small integral membrane protein
MIRLVKALLVLAIGLQALFYALQNLANHEAAQGALAAVLSGADHSIYPSTLFFYLASPTLHWIALGIVLLGEFAIGYFGIKGGWDLWRARGGSNEEFAAAKASGILAAGLALLLWFGIFLVMGGAFFQMWQTTLGQGSMGDAFTFSAISVLAILFVCHTPD